MFTEIDSIVLDLKTNKILNRRKAFNALYDILNHRLTTLQTFLNDDDDYDWEKLFNATHAGIIIQSQKLYSDNKELSENDLSITHFSRMILKLCGSPVNGETSLRFFFSNSTIIFVFSRARHSISINNISCL